MDDLKDFEDILEEAPLSVTCHCDDEGEEVSTASVTAVDGGRECPAVPLGVCVVMYPEPGCRGEPVNVIKGGFTRGIQEDARLVK